MKKAQTINISPLRGDHVPELIDMPFSVLTPVTDVIIPTKFYVDPLKGFWEEAPPKVPFPILFGATVTTLLHKPCWLWLKQDCFAIWGERVYTRLTYFPYNLDFDPMTLIPDLSLDILRMYRSENEVSRSWCRHDIHTNGTKEWQRKYCITAQLTPTGSGVSVRLIEPYILTLPLSYSSAISVWTYIFMASVTVLCIVIYCIAALYVYTCLPSVVPTHLLTIPNPFQEVNSIFSARR